jgi:CubicO group peptidase (beta-lactamase class C family)
VELSSEPDETYIPAMADLTPPLVFLPKNHGPFRPIEARAFGLTQVFCQAVLDHQFRSEEVPGFAWALASGGRVIARGASGRRSAPAYPVRPTTLFDLASITKGLTLLAVMEGFQDGLYSLDEPVRNVVDLSRWDLGESTSNFADSTMEQWLRHEGMGPRNAISVDADLRPTQYSPLSRDDYLQRLTSRFNPAHYVFGHDAGGPLSVTLQNTYSNVRFALLGQIVAERRETAWAEVVDDLARRLNWRMPPSQCRTMFDPDMAEPYVAEPAAPMTSAGVLPFDFAAPAQVSMASVEELCALGAALSEGSRFLTPDNVRYVASMSNLGLKQLQNNGVGRGLGVEVRPHGDSISMMLSGASTGGRTILAVDPFRQLVVSVACTSGRKSLHDVAGLLMEVARHTQDHPGPPPRLPIAWKQLLETSPYLVGSTWHTIFGAVGSDVVAMPPNGTRLAGAEFLSPLPDGRFARLTTDTSNDLAPVELVLDSKARPVGITYLGVRMTTADQYKRDMADAHDVRWGREMQSIAEYVREHAADDHRQREVRMTVGRRLAAVLAHAADGRPAPRTADALVSALEGDTLQWVTPVLSGPESPDVVAVLALFLGPRGGLSRLIAGSKPRDMTRLVLLNKLARSLGFASGASPLQSRRRRPRPIEDSHLLADDMHPAVRQAHVIVNTPGVKPADLVRQLQQVPWHEDSVLARQVVHSMLENPFGWYLAAWETPGSSSVLKAARHDFMYRVNHGRLRGTPAARLLPCVLSGEIAGVDDRNHWSAEARVMHDWMTAQIETSSIEEWEGRGLDLGQRGLV